MSHGIMCEVMNAERSTIWFLDEANNEMWAPPAPELPEGLTIPFGKGLVGHVAQRARETKSFRQSVLCTNDPKSSPLFHGDPDDSFTTKSLLSVPILSAENKKLLGMIQLVNKRSKTELEDSIGFSESDIRLAEVCASIVAEELIHLMVDQIATKAEIDAGREKKRGFSGSDTSWLNEYYHAAKNGDATKLRTESMIQ